MGILAVSEEFFCLKDPPAAFLGLAKLSFKLEKSFTNVNFASYF